MSIVTVSPESALIAAAVLMGATVRFAMLLWQRKQLFPRRSTSDGVR